MRTVLVLSVLLAVCYGRQGFGPGEQDWGYVNVRPEAYMFWWLYETTADVANITECPLVIWLQGGPGASSTGYGNFAELGPLDADLNPRNYTWVKDVNVLFIDNPVGAGYSYVTNTSLLSTTNKQIAADLITLLVGFFAVRPEFEDVPLYITTESYGGKMTAELALELDKKVRAGEIKANLLGVTLIDSWISPIDSVLNWAPFLYNFGAIDREGYNAIKAGAQQTKAALDAGSYLLAIQWWGNTTSIILNVTQGIDFYNIMTRVETAQSYRSDDIPQPEVRATVEEKIALLMNGDVKKALNISVTQGAQRHLVFRALREDFMRPVTNIIEELLKRAMHGRGKKVAREQRKFERK